MKTLKLYISFIIALCAFQQNAKAYGWDAMAHFEGEARHRTTALSIGNQIYCGLGHYNGAGPNILFADWWAYDPSSNSWSQKADYMGGPTYHSMAFTLNGKGYVGTGRIDWPSIQLVKDFYEYDPVLNAWSQKTDFPGSGRRGGVGFAIGDYGYFGTGSYNNDFYRYDPTTDTWTPVASMPTQGRISAVAFTIGNYGYVGTGSVGGSTKDFWRYDPSNNQWTQLANVGTINRTESSGFAQGGKGYILTGDNYSSGTNYKDMYEYDPATNVWTQLEDFPGSARRYMSSVTHNDGMTYCGLGTSGTNYADWWRFDRLAGLIEQQLETMEVTVYPNPTSDELNISIDEELPAEVDVSLISFTGEELISESFKKDTYFDVKEFSAGNYILNFTYKDKVLASKKVIIQ